MIFSCRPNSKRAPSSRRIREESGEKLSLRLSCRAAAADDPGLMRVILINPVLFNP